MVGVFARILTVVVALASLASASGEVRSLTLPQALQIAAQQNPDVALSRLDTQRAEASIHVAQDPFRPKIYGGSGLAYTYGYPNSIDGNAPSLFEVKTNMSLFDRSKSYAVVSARESARGAQQGAQAKAEEVAYQAADLFLTASQIEHESDTLNQQLPNLQSVLNTMTAAVGEGTELPLEQKRAQLNLATSQERLESARLDSDYYEMLLAVCARLSRH